MSPSFPLCGASPLRSRVSSGSTKRRGTSGSRESRDGVLDRPLHQRLRPEDSPLNRPYRVFLKLTCQFWYGGDTLHPFSDEFGSEAPTSSETFKEYGTNTVDVPGEGLGVTRVDVRHWTRCFVKGVGGRSPLCKGWSPRCSRRTPRTV